MTLRLSRVKTNLDVRKDGGRKARAELKEVPPNAVANEKC